jgi:hypothetical protein
LFELDNEGSMGSNQLLPWSILEVEVLSVFGKITGSSNSEFLVFLYLVVVDNLGGALLHVWFLESLKFFLEL